MLFVSDLDKENDIVIVGNTETGIFSKIGSKDLIKCHRDTNTIIYGISVSDFNITQDMYEEAIIVPARVFDNSESYKTYVINKFDLKFIANSSCEMSKEERYKLYMKYICKNKLCNVCDSVISLTVDGLDDNLKTVDNIVFNYLEISDSKSFTKISDRIFVSSSDNYVYDETSGDFSLILKDNYNPDNTKVINNNIKDIDVVSVPEFVSSIDFFRMKCNYLVIFEIPNTIKVVMNSSYALPNTILKIPKGIESLFTDCNCLKIIY